MASVTRILLALGVVAMIAALDATFGSLLVITPLHAVVIALVSWHAGLGQGVLMALAAGGARMLAELTWGGTVPALVWNGAAWTAAFLTLARFADWARARRDEVLSLEARVSELVQVEHNYARTDPLTSLCNRRAFIDALQQAEARSRRGGGALAVARLDLEAFRQLNDVYSRADGDQVLRAVATSLSLATRMGDLAARLDNDEFAILLYGCGPDDAERVGQRLVSEVAELARAYPESRLAASIGIACFTAPGPDPDEMMRVAGVALRQARLDGGGRVVVERASPSGGARHIGQG